MFLLLRLKKIIKRLYINFLYDPRIIVTWGLFLLGLKTIDRPTCIESDELIALIKEEKSLIRLGDGEAFIFFGGDIPGNQKFVPELRSLFAEIVREYNQSSPFLLGIATKYVFLSKRELLEKRLFKIWMPFQVFFHLFFNKQQAFFDAHSFYRTGFFMKALHEQLVSNSVLVVANEQQIDDIKKTKFCSMYNVSFLVGPPHDGFSQWETLFERITSLVNNDKRRWRVVLSIGPTSKVLVYKLSNIGVVSYDIGQGITVMYGDSHIEKILV